MKISARGMAFISSWEGIVPGPYKDSVGVWTYGVGHTAAAGFPNPIDLPRGMPADLRNEVELVLHLFCDDIQFYADAVARAVTVPVTQQEFDALCSFHYNTGAIGACTLVKKLNAGDRAGAIAEFDKWHKPPEITQRRNSEKALFSSGKYPDRPSTVWGVDKNGKVIWTPAATLSFAEVVTILEQIFADDEPDPEPLPPTDDRVSQLEQAVQRLAERIGEIETILEDLAEALRAKRNHLSER